MTRCRRSSGFHPWKSAESTLLAPILVLTRRSRGLTRHRRLPAAQPALATRHRHRYATRQSPVAAPLPLTGRIDKHVLQLQTLLARMDGIPRRSRPRRLTRRRDPWRAAHAMRTRSMLDTALPRCSTSSVLERLFPLQLDRTRLGARGRSKERSDRLPRTRPLQPTLPPPGAARFAPRWQLRQSQLGGRRRR